MPDPTTSVVFMPDDAPAAPAAPKTYSREALVAKGMSKGWDKARAEAAADVKLARETSKVWESAAPEEDFSAVAKRAGELVPDGYMAPEEVSSMPTLLPKREPLPLPASTPPTRMRSREELTPGEIRAVDVAERAREDADAREMSRKAQEIAGTASLVTDPLGLYSKGVNRTIGRAAAGMSHFLSKVGPEQEPTDVELKLRMSPPSEDKDLAYTVPETDLPSEAFDFAKERVKEAWQDSPAYALSSFLTEDVPRGLSAAKQGLDTYGEWAARTNKQNALKPIGRAPTLSDIAGNTQSWDVIPTRGTRERATNARMFQQRPEELVPLGDYRLDQSLFDVLDTPEGSVEKGLDKTPGFKQWEQEHPERAQKARETVATQKAERAPAERAAQQEAAKKKTLNEYFDQNLLPPIEALADYNLTPEAYQALQKLGAATGKQTEEGALVLPSANSADIARRFLQLSKDDPEKFARHVAALPKGP